MIKRITIRNFQRHEDLTVDFAPGVTTIVGESDRGKSAIFRALRWVATNQPSGTAFIRHGQREASCEVVTDKHTVTRIRGAENKYIVDGQELVGFGQSVPEEVTAALALGAHNFQGQHDPPFWMSLTAGEVAQQMNQIIDLDIIDNTLKCLNSDLRKGRIEEEAAKLNVAQISASLQMTDHVEEMTKDFDTVLLWRGRVENTEKKVVELRQALDAAHVKQEIIETYVPIIAQFEQVETIHDTMVAETEAFEALSAVIDKCRGAEASAGIEVPDITDIEDQYALITKTEAYISQLSDHLQEIKERKQVLCQKQTDFHKTQETFASMIGTTCPLCGNKIKSLECFSATHT